MTPPMRAIFFGTPQLAVPSLEAVHGVADVVQVVCQPDRPAGRGMKLRPPPVKERALELGLDVVQPRKVRTPDFAASLRALEADVAVVIAYGRILPKAVLDAPRRGCVNVHASILPKLRGAGPIHWAIVNGEPETGVCLMQMDEGMDTGPVITCERTPIGPDETTAELGARLADMGAGLLRAHLGAWVEGALEVTPQDHDAATLAPLLKKDDGRVDWALPAQRVHDLVRGMFPWPGAFTTLGGEVLKLHATRVHAPHGQLGAPGEILPVGDLVVACGEGAVAIERLQLQGKKKLAAKDFLVGRPLSAGERLGDIET
ncbi:MAG: methionyl-tRNA formyltransferase [Myxococcota bacterium]|nr:methionyl-tRNA formyltransferase [Myxococcota bacterium]